MEEKSMERERNNSWSREYHIMYGGSVRMGMAVNGMGSLVLPVFFKDLLSYMF